MRVIVLVKATVDSEAGVMPSAELFEAMGNYNEELVNAGIMQAGEGLKPSSEGKRILFDGEARTVTDGPFSAVNELVAGFWLWEVRDMDEALEWVKRCPNPMLGPSEIEIRPLYELEDFAEDALPEHLEREERLRREIEVDRAQAFPSTPFQVRATVNGSNAMNTAEPLPRGEIIRQLDGTYELFPVPAEEDTLRSILAECLAEWEHVRIGMLVPGAVWEIKPPRQPRTGFLDGYLTVDFEDWHLHLCIGEQKAADPETARLRRAARAELYRRLNPDHQPTSWGFRLFNGGGQQQITVLLPNPHLDERQNYMESPDWDRLYLWDRLREKYLAMGSDPVDRSAPGFFHG